MNKQKITQEERLYLILMDLKTSVQRLKEDQKNFNSEIHKCVALSKKTYKETNQKYQQVVKLAEGSFLEVQNQNQLIKKQNLIHQGLTKSNEELVQKTKQQNKKLVQIFEEQKLCIDRVLKANQVIVNQQLTTICKNQQIMIQNQIKQFDIQNAFIEQQRLKLQLAFQAVGNFQNRNKDLQQKLLTQKQEIEKFIDAATHKNQMLVVDLIYQRANEADQKYNYQVNLIQNIKNDFNNRKNQSISQLQQIIRQSKNQIENKLNQIEKLKNLTHSIKNQSQSYSIEQKKLFNNTKQQFDNIKRLKSELQRKQSDMEDKIRNIESQTRKTNQKQNQNENKLNSLDKKIKDTDNNLNADQRKIKDVQNKLSAIERQVKDLAVRIGQNTNKEEINKLNSKFQGLDSRIKELQNQSKHDRHRSHSRKKH